jgi:hypothetical protein
MRFTRMFGHRCTGFVTGAASLSGIASTSSRYSISNSRISRRNGNRLKKC